MIDLVDGVLLTASYVGLVLLVGVPGFLLYVWPQGRWNSAFTALAWSGWLLLVLTTAGLLLTASARTHYGLRDVIATQVGTSLVARLALLCIAGAWLAEVPSCYGADNGTFMAPAKVRAGLVALALAPLTFVSASRSVRGPWAAVTAVMDAAHVAAMTLWLASLVVLAVRLMPQQHLTADQLRQVIPRFTVVAAVCATTIAVTGLVVALAQSHGARLLHSGYWTLVLAKTAVLAVIVIAGFEGRRYTRARHAGERGPHAERTAVAVELLMATTALALSAALTLTAS